MSDVLEALTAYNDLYHEISSRHFSNAAPLRAVGPGAMPRNTETGKEYSFEAVPTVHRFCQDRSFVRGIMGPFGSGKSAGCTMDIMLKALAQAPDRKGVRRTRWACVRNTYKMLDDTTIKTVLDWFPDGVYGRYHKTAHEHLIRVRCDDGTTAEVHLLFRALDRPDHVRNLLSLELTGAWLNEAREIDPLIARAIRGRVGRFPAQKDGGASWYGVIMDTNPPDVESWWYRLFEELRPANARLFRQPSGRGKSAENRANLPSDYYDNLMIDADEEFIKAYVDGEYAFTRDGKPVYANYKDALHFSSTPLKAVVGVPLVMGWDFALSPACVITQLLPIGKFMVLKEIVGADMGLRQFVNMLVKPVLMSQFRGHQLLGVGDPAGVRRSDTDERTCFMELKELGLPAVPARSNSLQARFESVNAFLTMMIEGNPAFILGPECPMLRKGFVSGYHFRRLQTSRGALYAPEPEKNEYSHPHDGLQYAAMYHDIALRKRVHRNLGNLHAPPRPLVPSGGWT